MACKLNESQFVKLLQCIGFNSDQLGGQSFDWLFDHEPLHPFFLWFLDELQASNALDFKDLQEFRALEVGDEDERCLVLTGCHLIEALSSWSLVEDERCIECCSEEDVNELQAQLQFLNFDQDHLGSTRDRLMIYQGELGERLLGVEKIVSCADMDIILSTEQIQLGSAKMNKSLEFAAGAVHELLAMYDSCPSRIDIDVCSGGSNDTVFLSSTTLDHYHAVEEAFTQCLVNFTKKLFFEGVAEIAGHADGNNCELLEINNPHLMLFKGVREDVVLSSCKELSYMELFYPFGESRRIDALVEEQSLMSACEHKQWIAQQINDLTDLGDQSILRAKLLSAETLLAITTRDLTQLSNIIVPAEVNEAAALQVVRLLRGDYDVKIARQDYFTINQDQVIHELIIQKSRNEFLTLSLEIESRWHHVLHKIMTALLSLLQQIYIAFQLRMKVVSYLDKQSNRIDHTVVDSQDRFVHNIHHIIRTGDELSSHSHSLFVTYCEIEQQAECLLNHIADETISLSVLCQLDHTEQCMLNKELANCGSLINSKSGTEPMLSSSTSPFPIVDTMTHLDALLKKLEHIVIGIIKDVDNKKKMLQKDLLLQMERELFTKFHCASNHFRQAIKDLDDRLCANSVM